MPILPIELRNKLERTIIEARDVAEAGSKAALEALAVHHHEPYGHMSPEERKLRNHLRSRARQLGDRQNSKGGLEIIHLICECAYEHWHRMLFARFLAENDLLIEPTMSVAISLEECEELAKEEEKDLWTLASEFAQRMLPQIFRPSDPILLITFANEHRIKLEKLLDDLETAVFTANDSIGWVYQFWQSKKKQQVDKSGRKIGANELPSVTQFFTEPYMVNFIIHNTLGAWYARRVFNHNPKLAEKAENEYELRQIISLPEISWEYLRFSRLENGEGQWSPAAGTYSSWPQDISELKILDPCCGSGHFIVGLFHHLVPLRMKEEGLSLKNAIDSVIRDNLYGLEIDQRCTQIAAFALALSAWTYPNANGYRVLPEMNIACSGIAPSMKKDEWVSLAEGNSRVQNSMITLFELFQNAPILGSLIDLSAAVENKLFESGFEEIRPLLKKISIQKEGDYETHERSVTAFGITNAIKLLQKSYHLVITNVPYLARLKQCSILKNYCEKKYPLAKTDLATVFLERSLNFLEKGGVVGVVIPQNWLFLKSYEDFRRKLLSGFRWNAIAKLGPAAFQDMNWWAANTMEVLISKNTPTKRSSILGIDTSKTRITNEKPNLLIKSKIFIINQFAQLKNPDSRIVFEDIFTGTLLEEYADCLQGISPADMGRFVFYFWEVPDLPEGRVYLQGSFKETELYDGRERILSLTDLENSLKDIGAAIRGRKAWGKRSVIVRQMRHLPATIGTGEPYDANVACVLPKNDKDLLSIWAYCSSEEFSKTVRILDQKTQVTNATLGKVPFDINHWQNIAKKLYPSGLPKAHTKNPTQWIFEGKISSSKESLLTAVSRLLGYRWPRQLSDEVKDFRNEMDNLTDKDGIVCVPSVRGENKASERLRMVLATAYGGNWSSNLELELIMATGSKSKNLDDWLQDDFFQHHCKVFYHRPFIWHIWDGRRRDGFHALVNYHKLAEGNGKGRQFLESLTYSYLGDWITRQKEGVKRGEGGAEDRLTAAVELQKRLIVIIEGEPPFDIFVRWKPIEEQCIGWEPDINDGVRLNIRPFMSKDIPGGRKGAGILRWKPNIKWSKDRGKEPYRSKEQYPWFWKDGEFTGNRVNDTHLTDEEKRRASEKGKEK